MLVEIMCDKFINHGIPRGRISLHAGLNTVMGSSNGSNSIGKSTFLKRAETKQTTTKFDCRIVMAFCTVEI